MVFWAVALAFLTSFFVLAATEKLMVAAATFSFCLMLIVLALMVGHA